METTTRTAYPEGADKPAMAAGQAQTRLPGQAIHCQKCGRTNDPAAMRCVQCGTDLLPGMGIGQRLVIVVISVLAGIASFAVVFSIASRAAEIEIKQLIYLIGLALFGILMIGFGVIQALRRIPPHERYAARAKQHASLNPLQAAADYGSALQGATFTQAFHYLKERAQLFQAAGMHTEAEKEWGLALQNISKRIEWNSDPDPELFRQRAEIYRVLGMPDEHAFELLCYSIQKEKTFKFGRDKPALGIQDGFTKGGEDLKRRELQAMRAEILKDPKFALYGQCRQCKAQVVLDPLLRCTRDPKHRNITDIRPALRQPGP